MHVYTQEILSCIHRRSLVYTQENLLCLHEFSWVYTRTSLVYTQENLLCIHTRISCVCPRDFHDCFVICLFLVDFQSLTRDPSMMVAEGLRSMLDHLTKYFPHV